MFSWFKKKKKEEVVTDNKHFVNVVENNESEIKPLTVGANYNSISGKESTTTGTSTLGANDEVYLNKPTEWFLNGENINSISSIEVPKGLGKSKPKKSITKNRVLKRDKNQGSRVLSILKENPEGLTRYEIKDVYIKQFGDILDTSLSRAIACLSYDTAITMTDITKLERYGKVCHIYKAN